MDQFEQIKKLKTQYIEAGKKIAGYESQLKSIEENEKTILKQCEEYGVTLSNIKKKQEELSKEYTSLIKEIEDALNPDIKPISEGCIIEDEIPFFPDEPLNELDFDVYDPFFDEEAF